MKSPRVIDSLSNLNFRTYNCHACLQSDGVDGVSISDKFWNRELKYSA